VPPNDWDEPNPALPYESSAAAIAAGGFLNLAELVQDGTASQGYQEQAHRILDTLLTPEFLAHETTGWEGLLKHGMYHQRKGLGVDESVMWGEYFLMEALYRVRHEQ
jgi:unsaturated chondroitin disaccharide hydrolase